MELIQKEKPIVRSNKKATRWLTRSAAIASLCVFSPVWALGVGSLKTESALNQPLNAKIALLGVVGNELESLTIRLAGPDVYERMGITRNELVDQLRFSIEDQQTKNPYIHVTSKNAVNEPFVNFLVEINWATGRLLREFTVLLDPSAAAEAEKARAIEDPEVAMADDAAETQSVSAPMMEPIAERIRKPKEGEVKTSSSGSINYGPVKQGQTLWRIAESIRPRNVTVEQMMLALYKSNPDAFFGDNISMLKAGAVLRIRNEKDILKTSIDEARTEVTRQHREWLAYRREKMAEHTLAADSTTARPIGTPTAPKRESIPAGESRLELVTPTAKDVGKTTVGNVATDVGLSTKSDDLKVELAMTNEMLEAANKENQELKGRINRLETQLKSMQGLLDIKNKNTDQVGSPDSDQGEAVTSINVLDDGQPLDLDAESQEKPAEKSLLNDPVTIATIVGALVLLGGFIWLLRKRTIRKVEEITIQGPLQFEKSQHTRFEKHAEENFGEDKATDFTPDDIFGSPSAIGQEPSKGSTLKSMSRPTLTAAEMKLLDPLTDEELEPFSQPISMAVSKPELADELDGVLSEPMDRSGRHDSGIDILAEADVYIAYGKYSKAEDVIKNAIAIDHDRQELKLKLLEIYVFANQPDSFLEKAEELFAALKGEKQHPIWRQVISFAQELGLSNPIFENSAATPIAMDDGFNEGDLDFLNESKLSSGVGRLSEQQAIAEEAAPSVPVFETSKPVELEDKLTIEERLESEIADGGAKESVFVDPLEDPMELRTNIAEVNNTENLEINEIVTPDVVGEPKSKRSAHASSIENMTNNQDAVAAGMTDEKPASEVTSIPQSQIDQFFGTDDVRSELAMPDIEQPLTPIPETDDQTKLDNDLAALAEAAEVDLVGPVDDALVEQNTPYIPDDVFIEQETKSIPFSASTASKSKSVSKPESAQESKPVSKPASKPVSKPVSKPSSLENVFAEPVSPPVDVAQTAPSVSDEPILDIAQTMSAPAKSGQESAFFLLDDEVDTKLDLARAYIEMGDKDGAIDLLDEVLDEGDERQKKQANDLMKLTNKQTAVS